MFLSTNLNSMVREANSRVVLKKIRKNGYEIVRIRPGHKARNNPQRFKDFLYPLIKQRDRGGDR